ncbi:MAG: hypothetical protein C5B51_16145 [Terriglobia bacterium]|nr:MAG: hypothetical protein C5B51_16145 [Terriglobia bacterium]
MKASAKVTPGETMRRFKAAREYALKLPQANGKSASLGFCAGGGDSFRFAGEVPELNRAVVFYGGPDGRKNERPRQKHTSPTSTRRPHIPLCFQEIGGNPAAAEEAWLRAIAFLKKQLAIN